MAARSTLTRRQWGARALALAGAGALGGCVVAPYGTYYRPIAAQPGAVERRGWCQGNAGPVTGDAPLRLERRSFDGGVEPFNC